jgi:toxin ParE1/3/4
MKRVVFLPAARADIEGIWNYTAGRWGKAQAERYTRLLHDACLGLAAGTHPSRSADHVRPGYQKAQAGSHTIFFRGVYPGDLEIVRILHQAMDVARHLPGIDG